jgi:ankyrin repeat protein
MSHHIVQTFPDLLHSVDKAGSNAALYAAKGGNVKILQLLANCKINVKQKNSEGCNILHMGCHNAKLEMSRYIIQAYPELLHSLDCDEWNAALHAARGGNTECLKLLAEKAVDIKHKDNEGLNILHIACFKSNLEMSRYIVNTYPGLLYDVVENGWSTALHAARGGNVKILQLLAEKDLDVRHTDNEGLNILHLACSYANLEMSRYIIQTYGDLLHSLDNNGWNAALHAARGGNVQILQLLAENGVDIKHKEHDGWNILHMACAHSNLEMSRFIIKTYPDLRQSVDNNGWNAALHAAAEGNAKILALLTDYHVNAKHQISDSRSILHVACFNANLEMAQYIIQTYPELLHGVDRGGNNAALHAARGGNVKILQLLSDNKVDVKLRNKNGRNILNVACVHSNLEMSRYILKKYPDLLHNVDCDGNNAALDAARGGNVEILQLLAENNVDITCQNNAGRNIFNIACVHSNLKMQHYIIKKYPQSSN